MTTRKRQQLQQLARHATNLAQFFQDCIIDGERAALARHDREDVAALYQYCNAVTDGLTTDQGNINTLIQYRKIGIKHR